MSCARKARRSKPPNGRSRKDGINGVESQATLRAAQAPYALHRAPQGRGSAAADRVPLEQAHLRPAHRRSGRSHGRQASSVDKELKGKVKNGAGTEAAAAVGKLIAERALKAEAGNVVFDRGGYLYHGRVKALADAAREAGLSF
jgi:hypothetical protein